MSDYWYKLYAGTRPPRRLFELVTVDVATEIYPLIQYTLGQTVFDQGNVKCLSGQYKATTIDELMRFVQWARVHKLRYTPIFRDCPDFALALAGKFPQTDWYGSPVGMINVMQGGQWHVMDIAFAYPNAENQTLALHIIEPQDGVIVPTARVAGQPIDLILMP
tara:strand:+ start:3324 stop:3812 length:489 start_codon:yes stop_codon:yes gene_type:complete